jgi:demethylmenaquinone methyltransferase/2-methoxy-6-polyprenyl-1,4-benzoquinol methylase
VSGPAQRLDREVEFFDKFAAEHGDYDVLGDGAYRRLTQIFEERVRPRPGERCVDLGCGTGAFTRRLTRFGLDVTGMDISPISVQRANEHADGARFVVGDITATGLPERSFDIIVYSGVLHHFASAMLRASVLKEGFRLLTDGGRLFAFDPNAHSPSMWLYRDPRSPLFSPKGKTENEVLLSRRELKGELAEAGFSKVDVRGVSGISFRYVESPAARIVLPLYNLYEQIVRHSPFERRVGTFVVSCAAK